jgi:Asp-tRNA(Asn)/Glu-tRNA(Gln) amidotransferase A subunit family amidase
VTLDVSLAQLAPALRRGDPPVAQFLDAVIQLVEAAEPRVQALIPEEGRAARLRREAKAVAQQHPAASQRALFSIPVGVKDIFHVDGFPTRAGSRLPPESLSGEEGEAVHRVRRAGAILLGKTVTTEFAYFAPGPTRNPRNLAHTPGGSSSGSAAAVAAGLCPLSLGTQTIGSVIRPASFCGIVGFKPTYRRIPVDGVIPLAPSLDHLGFFTRDVAGAAVAAEILCDGWAAVRDTPTPVLGVPSGPYLAQAGEVSRLHFEQAIERLTQAGFVVLNVDVMADFDDIAARHQLILAAEAARVHALWFERYGHLYHERTARLLREGRAISDEDLAAARDGQAVLRRELQGAMERDGIDLWVAPSTVGPAPRGLESTGDPVMNMPWTQAGFPALTLPCGLDEDGLPLGLQLVARFYDDERLLAWAETIERALGMSLGLAVLGIDAVPAGRGG